MSVLEREGKNYEGDLILYLEIQENQLKIIKLASQNLFINIVKVSKSH